MGKKRGSSVPWMTSVEPRWLTRDFVLSLHAQLIIEFGGASMALRDSALLESALARPLNKWAYDNERNLTVLAAAYCYGLVKSHPFMDGNKRVGFVASVVFLECSDVRFEAPEVQAAVMIEGVADGSYDENVLATWVREHCRAG